MIVEDLGAETRFGQSAALTDAGVCSGVSVAIGPADRPYGVLGAHTARRRSFSPDDVNFLSSVAGMLGAAWQRREAEAALAKMTALLDRTQELSKVGGWEYDVTTETLTWTDEVYRIYGLDPATGGWPDVAPAVAAFDEHSAPIIDAAFKRLRAEGEPYDLELGLIRHDGERIWIRCSGYPIFDDGRIVRVGGDIADITERKRAESEIRALNAELEQRVALRTEELRATNQELEAFAYSVSHDLRAPLRAMDGFSLVLLDGYGKQLDERGRHYLARVRAGAQRMGTMIDELLELSRVSRAEVHRETVNLSALAVEIAAELRAEQPGRDVECVIPDGLSATGDVALVRTVLENLLSNAWKFTSAREHARVELGETDHDGAAAYFVRDNGAGFDMEQAAQLFTPFQRLHRVEEFPGNGIGLASVQRIIARHGGRIIAQGEVGRGATFTFTLEPDRDTP